MPRIKTIAILFLSAALVLPPARMAARTSVSPERLKSRVEFLSDTLCDGRSMGTRGNFEAMAYIARNFCACGMEVELQSFEVDGRTGHNVIARHFGNPAFPAYTLVTAYYDGMGRIGGRMFPGADANASGVAALLETAWYLKDSPGNYIFVALDGHNANMSGAMCCQQKFRNPRRVVNLDILGSTLAPVTPLKPNYLIVLGGAQYARSLESEDLFNDLVLYYDYYGSQRFTELFYKNISDQKYWLDNGVTCFMFTSGITENTNKYYDDAWSLDYDIFAKRVSLICRWLAKQ